MTKSSEIQRSGKNSRLRGDAAEHAGVFILHLSLDDAMAKAAIVGRGRNHGPDLFRWIKSAIDHAERSKDFAPAEAIERFIGYALQGCAKQHEPDVAVNGA